VSAYTIAKELVLIPLPYKDQGAATTFFVFGFLRFSPLLSPMPLDCVKSGPQTILD
jgi:hypothetical protein